MKRLLIVAGAALLIFIAWFLIAQRSDVTNSVFSDNITLYVYTLRGEPTGGASVAVPFADSTERRHWLSAVVGGAGGPWRVENIPAHVEAGVRNMAHFTLPEDASLQDGDEISITLALTSNRLASWDGSQPQDGAYLKTTAAVEEYETGDIIGVDIPGWGPGIYRGGVSPAVTFSFKTHTAEASSHVIDTYTDLDMPDTTQEPAECAPTAASNALTGLAREHDREDDLPETDEMIDELKEAMDFDDGVNGPQNFLDGKNAFVRDNFLPITTQMIESPTIEEIAEAIDNGCAIEADLAFFENRNGRSVQIGNHMVNITGAYDDGETTGIHGHDPATGDGVEVWRFRDGDRWPYINYHREHPTVIKQIYVQCWVDEETSETSLIETEEGGADFVTSGEDLEEEGSKDVEMLVIDGHYFPAYQFKVAGPDNCDAYHYHIEGGLAYGLQDAESLEVIEMRDPNPPACGFGKISEVPKETITISYEQGLELVRYLVD